MRKTVEILPFQRFLWYNESMKNEMCNQLFSIEREIAGFPFEERCIQRQSRAKPVLDALLSWAECSKTPPKSALGRAVCYLKEQWPYLIRYLEDGRLEVSNNRAKRSIKPFVMDRKNFLFANGAQGSAIITGFYERYGWKFLCMVQGDGEPDMIKMYSYNL